MLNRTVNKLNIFILKPKILQIACFALVCFMISCQESKKEEVKAVKPRSTGSARRACLNTVSYSFIKPDNDYGYNGNGCVTYFVHKGTSRNFKVKMANTSGSPLTIKLRIDHPDGTLLSYSVVSYTGGSISFGAPVPPGSFGAYILWTGTNVPAYTTYELTFKITGATSGSSENGIDLTLVAPCTQSAGLDCDADDKLHVVLAQ